MQRNICKVERGTGKEIVVLQGVGFVGAMMAAVAADCEIEGKAPYLLKNNFRATWVSEAYSEADIIVVKKNLYDMMKN